MKIPSRLRRISEDDSGQALVLGASCMAVLLAAVSLAVDVGYLHYRQAQLQAAADSAAIAAGLEIGNCSKTVCGNMTTAAEQALMEDGITSATITPTTDQCTVSSTTSLAMIINVAPCVLGATDPNNGNTSMAEVVLTEPENTFFGAFAGMRTVNLTARAEAGEAYYLDNSGGNCVYTQSISFNSSGSLDLNGCGIYDNGNLQTNNGDAATATTFLYYGTWSPNNCNKSCTWTLGSSQTQPTHTNTPQSDPLASLTPPSKPGTQYSGSTSFNSGTNNLSPGYYPNGFNINGGTVNLSPGLYYFNGSVNVDSGATLECTTCAGGAGVTLYFASGTLQANSGSTIKLAAASTGSTSNGDVANMLLWEATSNGSGMTIDSSSSSYFTGIVYLPDQSLTLNSGSGVTLNSTATSTALDVQSIMIDSSETFVINGAGGYLNGGGKTLGSFALAE